MTTTAPTYLVVADDSPAFLSALRFACVAARAARTQVTILCVIEPDAIEAWCGVERAMDDEAFSTARESMATHEETVRTLSGQAPLCLYKKGGRREVLGDFLKQQGAGGVAALVLGAGAKGSTQAHLIAHMASEKSLATLAVPLIIVPGKD